MTANVYRCRIWLSERPDAAVAAADALVTESRDAGEPLLLAAALTIAARARLAAGQPEDALACSTRALALRDSVGGLEEDEADVFLAHADALAACGRVAEAEMTLERGRQRLLEIVARTGDPAWRVRFLHDVAANQRLAPRDSVRTRDR